MAKYMIHAVPSRLWYVENHLIPSMLEQNIKREDINMYVDISKEGNLQSCIKSFREVDDSVDGTWHLQDDVILCHDFKEKTEQYDSGIVCAFKSRYDGKCPAGLVSVQEMWFSFPCIRIPNHTAKECSKWIAECIIGNNIYKSWWQKGVNDDLLFKRYVKDYYKNDKVLNLKPNLVDHVDYLIGGSVNGANRAIKIVRSEYWEDEYLVTELESRLKMLYNKNVE